MKNIVIALLAIAAIAGWIVDTQAEELLFEYTLLEPSEGDLEDEIEQHEFKVEGAVDLTDMTDGGIGWTVGAAYQANVWSFDDDRFDDLELHKVKIPVSASFMATERIPLTVTLEPGIHSDFEDVDEDDFRLDARVVGVYAQSQALQWVLGIAVGEEFGDTQAFPILGARWQATDALMLDLVFPKPKISYAATDSLNLVAAAAPAGGEWNVGEDSERQIDVRQEGFRLGAGIEYQIIEGGWLYVMAGAEVEREVDAAVDDESILDDEIDLDDASFIQIGFRVM